jgi:hypothetical protein
MVFVPYGTFVMVKVRAKGEASAGKNCTSPVTYEADASPLLIRAWIGGLGHVVRRVGGPGGRRCDAGGENGQG